MDASVGHKEDLIPSFVVIVIKVAECVLIVITDKHYTTNIREVCHLRRQLPGSAERGHA